MYKGDIMSAAQPAARPVRLPFPLQEKERVLALYRRHWWFLWPKAVVMAVFALAVVAAAAWLLSQAGVLDDLGIYFWAVALLWLAYWALRILMDWYRYHHDIWVVTDQRIVDSFKAHPFSLRVNTADLVNIQDMAVVKSGILPTILGYGDVVCETAGTDHVSFRISGVPHPEAIQLLIDRERDRERASGGGANV